MNILLVEDEISTRLIIGHHLRKWGFQVMEADTGQKALSFVGDINLCIIDVNLTDMTGLELSQKMVESKKHGPKDIIFMTADPGLAMEIQSKGFHVLTKPFEWNHLKEKVNGLLPAG